MIVKVLNKDITEEQTGKSACTFAIVECSKVTEEETGNLVNNKSEFIPLLHCVSWRFFQSSGSSEHRLEQTEDNT